MPSKTHRRLVHPLWHGGPHGILEMDEQDIVRIARKPPEPSADDLRRYHQDSVTTAENWYGIPLPNLESVKVAVRLFAEGRYQRAQSTTIAQLPDLAAIPYMTVLAERGSDRFVERVIADIEDVFSGAYATWPKPEKVPRYLCMHHARGDNDIYVDRSPYYEGSWDHDGPGSFHKANLTVKALKAGGYELHIYHAYHGNQAEVRLAEALGARMRFTSCLYLRAWASPNERFAIPAAFFGEMLTALGSDADPQETAAAFVAHQNHTISHPSDEGRGWYEIPGTAVKAFAEIDCGHIAYNARRNGGSAMILEDGVISGPTRVHENGRPYTAGIRLTLLPREESAAGDEACIAALASLRALAPDLPSVR